MDGVLNDSCWDNWIPLNFSLGAYDPAPWYSEIPPYDYLNGSLSVCNDNDNLYLAARLYNLTDNVYLWILLDDNATHDDYYEESCKGRGALLERFSRGNRITTGFLVSYDNESWSCQGQGSVTPTIEDANDPSYWWMVRWNWTTSFNPSGETDYALELSFRFRHNDSESQMLPDRVPLLRLHLVMTVSEYYPSGGGKYRGHYGFPPGTYKDHINPGLYREDDFLEWFPIPCEFDLPTLPPLPLPSLPVIIALVLVVSIGVAVVRRRQH